MVLIIGHPIISIDSTAKILEIMRSGVVCKIHSEIDNQKCYGTGFLCYIPIGNEKLTVMITCNHILNEEYLNNNKSIKIEINNELKEINIKDNRKIYTNKMFNITIIEINSKKDKIKQFLDLDEAIFNEDFYHEKEVYILQYALGENISVSYGSTLRISWGSFDFSYNCSTNLGSSGSPIFNFSNHKVIGWHKEGDKRLKFNIGGFLNVAIQDFFDSIKNYKENDFSNFKLISAGSYGEVYSAYSIKDEKEICLKKINKERMRLNYQQNELNDYLNDLNNEIRILKLFSKNENSLKFYGTYEEGNNKIIVMEKCDMNLKEYVKKKNVSLKPNEIKQKFLKMNELFKLIQDNNIIHRDLKLENFLIKFIDKEKTKYILKLGDYGTWKFKLESNGIFSGLKGTIETVAPEIILQKTKKYESIVDIFSLGIILYQLSHNLRHPFGENYIGYLMKYQNNYEKDNLAVNFDKSIEDKNFKDLLTKMLKINPKNRLNWEDYFQHPFFN